MAYLFDSNILLRLVHRNHPEHWLIRRAVRTLHQRGEQSYYTSQNLVEFWNVATRPATARGGLGRLPADADHAARVVERIMTLLPDTPAVHVEWRRLVVAHAVQGVQVHDARLVAAMHVHGISHILTLNDAHFARYPGITAVHPQAV
ncbi:MAG: type II toxin-antitoxin system VapC family toxin [Armatimonadota bacterium]|nr:type II toxin-antitoxin system VapC family toxin [Armatimonadota bacterium]